MSIPKFGRGGTAKITARFRDPEGVLTDADPVTFDVIDPDGLVVVSNSPPSEHPGTGLYEGHWPVPGNAVEGIWTMRFDGVMDGQPVGGEEGGEKPFEVVAAGSVDFEDEGIGPCSPFCELGDLDCDDATGGSDVLATDFVVAVSEFLWAESGRQFDGACVDARRPCARACFPPLDYPHVSKPWGLSVYLACGCGPDAACACGPLEKLALPRLPVRSIVRVTTAAGTSEEDDVDEGLYELAGDRWLVRLPDPDGSNPGWPIDGSLEIEYEWGRSVPKLGKLAAAELACELLKAHRPGGEGCRLPPNVQSVVRTNVTFAIRDPSALFRRKPGEPLSTGLPLVDAFLAAFNPHGAEEGPLVLSPDLDPEAWHPA